MVATTMLAFIAMLAANELKGLLALLPRQDKAPTQ